jgi:periplasmic protein TonB
MFEDSIFESTGSIRTHSRRWMFATLAFNISILLVLILLPLIHPDALPELTAPILMAAPAPPVEEIKLQSLPSHSNDTHPQLPDPFRAPRIIPTDIPLSNEPDTSARIDLSDNFPGGPGPANADSPWGHQPTVVVQQAPKQPAHVSQGIMEGRVYDKILPVYPAIARAVHTEGTVVLEATISKSGAIANLHVLSGPAILQQAAIDAVRQWRYRPYLLNGEPVDVETTVNVVFKLN